jgi:type IV pilus assembly protein PilN
MKISVNLATRPYVELRPFFLRLRFLMAVLAAVAIGFAITAHVMQSRVDAQQSQLAVVKGQTLTVQQERTRDELRMRQPKNTAVLDRAHFLNSLFLHKSFSWTAVMMDLETVLPVGVQVTSIDPQISADGSVGIRLRVAGDRDRAVQLLRNLEHSKRFLQPRLSTEVSQVKEGQQGSAASSANPASGAPPGAEFDILATYNPLPEGQAYPKLKAAVAAPAQSQDANTGASTSPAFDTSGKHGVVLKPYQAPAQPSGQAARPAASTPASSGPRRQP